MWPSHPDKTPQFFAWLTGAGIYHGKLEFEDQKAGGTLFSEKTLIPYTSDTHVEVASPVGMALTQFHCMLLYRDRSVGVARGAGRLSLTMQDNNLVTKPRNGARTHSSSPPSPPLPPSLPPSLPVCDYRVEAICVLNQKKVFEDKSYARVCGSVGRVTMSL